MRGTGYNDNALDRPVWGSAIAYELWSRPDPAAAEGGRAFAVRVIYNGATQPLPACGGLAFCSWEAFAALLATFFPVEDACPEFYKRWAARATGR